MNRERNCHRHPIYCPNDNVKGQSPVRPLTLTMAVELRRMNLQMREQKRKSTRMDVDVVVVVVVVVVVGSPDSVEVQSALQALLRLASDCFSCCCWYGIYPLPSVIRDRLMNLGRRMCSCVIIGLMPLVH